MTAAPVHFDNAERYEDFMGPWSRAIGAQFLDWLALPAGLDWLDLGCGTGAFTRLLLEACAPASVIGVDPSPEQIAYTRALAISERAEFRVAGAEALPIADESFDVVASALVINFIGDRPRALAEMRRVARAGGTVCGYVWDFPSGHGVSWPLERGFKATGIEAPDVPGKEESSVDALRSLFGNAGYGDIDAIAITATRTFLSFKDYSFPSATTDRLPTRFVPAP
jgi:SAM-dependent methyltransferase